MSESSLTRQSGQRWLYGLVIPFIYLVVEFSFNHQLIMVLDETVTNATLENLEFWGRVIAGVGLGLVIHRLLARRTQRLLLSLAVSLMLGIAIMWQFQQSLIQYLVSQADLNDKRAAVLLNITASRHMDEHLKTEQGDPLIIGRFEGLERNIVLTMFPAAALYQHNREKALTSWLGERTVLESNMIPTEVADNAFKNLIVPPVAIGASIAFALLNLCAVISFMIGRYKYQWRRPTMAASLLVCLIYTLTQKNIFLDSPGFVNGFGPGLWSNNFALAILVEWASRASSSWAVASQVIHHFIAFDFAFGTKSFLH